MPCFRQDIRMLKDPNTPVFEEKWPSMRPTILKLLRQEAVTRAEWHDLFWLVHSVCLWDDKVDMAITIISFFPQYYLFRDPQKFMER